jgi:hypothetical protein
MCPNGDDFRAKLGEHAEVSQRYRKKRSQPELPPTFVSPKKMIWGLRSPHQQSGDFLLRVATANMFLNQNTLCILYSRVRKNVGPVSAVVF